MGFVCPLGDGELMTEIPSSGYTGKKPVLSEKQLRAMSRKHLLMMIRDLECELAIVRAEKEKTILSFRAGVELLQGLVAVAD